MRIIILILASVGALVNTTYGQFVYFNLINNLENSNSALFSSKILIRNNQYQLFGNNMILPGNSLGISHYSFDGILEYENYLTLNYSFGAGTFGLNSEGVDILDDSTVIVANTPATCVFTDYFSLTRYNILGDTIWSRKYSELVPSTCNDDLKLWGVNHLPNGNILVIGERKYTDFAIEDSTFKAYVEIDRTNGDVLQYHENEKTYDTFFLGSNKIDGFRILDENTILHWGKTNHNPNNSPQRFVKKTDRYGNFIDSLQFGNPEFDERGFSALELLQGDSAVFMFMHSVDYLGGTSYTIKPRLVFIKVSTMEVLDEIEYDIPFIDANIWGSASFQSIIQTTGNEIVASFDITPTSNYVQTGIVKLSSTGEIIWWNLYEPNINTESFELLYDVVEGSDGGYAAVGMMILSLGSPSKQWLLKIDACGYEEPIDCPEVIVDGIAVKSHSSFTAWPNPFNRELKANLPEDAVLVEWLDMSGRIIHSEKVFYPKQSFNLSKLAEGNYMMRVVMQDGTSSVKRVMKQ